MRRLGLVEFLTLDGVMQSFGGPVVQCASTGTGIVRLGYEAGAGA